jgi:chromosome segregation ATPase
LQTKNSAVRIHNEADSLLGLQKSNSKGMSEAAQTKYAKEIRSELLVELEQERLFLESQMEQLSLAVTQAKQSANLLHEKEQTTSEKAAGVQQPVALAREKKTNLADQRKELNQKCQILQNEVDKTANVLVEKNRILSSLQSEVAQLKNRLDNIQQEMSVRRHSRKGQ